MEIVLDVIDFKLFFKVFSCVLCGILLGGLKRWFGVRDVWINYNKNILFFFCDVKIIKWFMFLINIGRLKIIVRYLF